MRQLTGITLALFALAGCDETATNVDFCPDPLVRQGDRCVPSDSITGDPTAGCLDNDATNFGVEVTEDDGSCLYNALFQVDMSDAGLANGDVVYVRGTFNSFDGTANPLTDDDGDDIWTATIPLGSGTYEYKYTINDIDNGGVDEQVPFECDFVPDAFDNRGFVLDSAPIELPVHRFGECVGGSGGFETITFDDANITYTLTGFNGAEDSTVVTDPMGGPNQVVRVVKSAAAATFAGTTVSTGPNLSVPEIPFSALNTRMTVRVLSPDAGIQVRLKVEDAADPGISVETEATTTVADAYEVLTFDFANPVVGAPLDFDSTYDKITIFFNFGVDGATAGEKIYHFDDIAFVDGFEPITFDDSGATYSLAGFGGAEDSTIVDDPTGGTNQVARVVRSDTALVFAGTTVGTKFNFSSGRIPFTAQNTRMTARVLSPTSGIQVRLKVEDSTNPGISVETEATTTTGGAFEVLTFDFANPVVGAPLNSANTYDKVTIFFNFGVDGATAGQQIYHFDDITFLGGFEAIDFDNPTITYSLAGFAGAENSAVVLDPTGGTNQVVRVIRADNALVFAGTTIGTRANFSSGRIPFDAGNTRMSASVLSPAAGIQVRLKVEDSSNPGISVETEATTTVDGAFETLVFDFSNEVVGAPLNPANTYDKVTIFFNFGVDGATAGEQTFYFDDVEFIGGVTFNPITFDDGAITYTLTGFAGAEDSTVVVDPTGGPNQVVRVVKSATAALFAGTTVSTGPNESIQPIPFTVDNTSMSVRTLSPDAGIQVRLKVEDSTDPGISVETEATTAVAGAFETLTFDFSNEVVGAPLNLDNTYDKVTIFFNFGVDGMTAGEKTYHFDDIALIQ